MDEKQDRMTERSGCLWSYGCLRLSFPSHHSGNTLKTQAVIFKAAVSKCMLLFFALYYCNITLKGHYVLLEKKLKLNIYDINAIITLNSYKLYFFVN